LNRRSFVYERNLRPEPGNKLLDVNQAASRLNVSRDKVYRLCNSGELPHIRYGEKGKIMIYESDLNEYQKECYIAVK